MYPQVGLRYLAPMDKDYREPRRRSCWEPDGDPTWAAAEEQERRNREATARAREKDWDEADAGQRHARAWRRLGFAPQVEEEAADVEIGGLMAPWRRE